MKRSPLVKLPTRNPLSAARIRELMADSPCFADSERDAEASPAEEYGEIRVRPDQVVKLSMSGPGETELRLEGETTWHLVPLSIDDVERLLWPTANSTRCPLIRLEGSNSAVWIRPSEVVCLARRVGVKVPGGVTDVYLRVDGDDSVHVGVHGMPDEVAAKLWPNEEG